jgi:hypothetical protein
MLTNGMRGQRKGQIGLVYFRKKNSLQKTLVYRPETETSSSLPFRKMAAGVIFKHGWQHSNPSFLRTYGRTPYQIVIFSY